MPSPPLDDPTEHPTLGLLGATGVGVGAIVGGGILALAGTAFATTGPSAVVAFTLNGLIALLTALTFAEMATSFPESGGTYTFAKKVLSVEAAFLVGWVVWFASIVAAVLYAFASTGYGLLVSSFTRSQVAAVFAGAILSMLPTMQLSGLLQPTSTLEGGGRLLGSLWPTTYYMRLSVGAFTKGLGLEEVGADLMPLALFGPVFLLAAAALLRKQEL